jgi:hypothetical protein
MSKKVVVRTGEEVPVSGQYRPSGARTEVTFVEGKRVPPNNFGERQKFFLVDTTKHKRG